MTPRAAIITSRRRLRAVSACVILLALATPALAQNANDAPDPAAETAAPLANPIGLTQQAAESMGFEQGLSSPLSIIILLTVLSLVPAVVARISCMHYIRGLFLRPPFGDSDLHREIELGLGLFEIPTRSTAALSLLLVATVCLTLSSIIFTLREYAASPES